jgi:hypothetical protein
VGSTENGETVRTDPADRLVNACVWLGVIGEHVAVTNDQRTPTLFFTRDEWNTFVAAVRDGRHDFDDLNRRLAAEPSSRTGVSGD